MTNPSDYTLAQATDPSTPAALLGEIATHRPDLRAAIAANPTAYPELLDWLRSFGDPAVDAALAARGGAAPAVQGYPGQQAGAQQAQGYQPQGHQPQQGYQGYQGYEAQQGAQPQQGNQPPTAQDPSATQALPTGYGAYGSTPAQAAAGQGASEWGPGGQWDATGQAGTSATPVSPTGAWTPQGGDNAWGQQPAGTANAAWGQQPAATANAAWGQGPATDPNAAWGQPQPAGKKSRRGLWIGIGVAGALVVAGGAFAANALWFSKVGGAKTPEAAVTQMLDAAVSKDLVGVYGVTSPAEFENVTTALDLFMDQLSADNDLDTGSLTTVYEDYIDAFDLKLDGLEVEVEEIEDGLAKVNIVAGELTVDADADALSDATIEAMAELETGPLSELFSLSGSSLPTDAEIRDEIGTAVAETFPVNVSAADLEDPFLMVVREGDSWYVSPTLTVLEYGAVAEGVERGSLPAADLAGKFDSPEAAADGLVAGVTEYLSSGDESALLATLPLADRRALSLYGNFDEVDVAELAELQDLLENSEFSASFAVRDEEDGVAWLRLETFSFSGEIDGVPGIIEIAGDCVTADVEGQAVNACLDDVPALKELGLGDLSLIAVEEEGSWYISYAGTVGDSSGVVLGNVLRLYDEGKLTDMQWWMDNLGVLGDELF